METLFVFCASTRSHIAVHFHLTFFFEIFVNFVKHGYDVSCSLRHEALAYCCAESEIESAVRLVQFSCTRLCTENKRNDSFCRRFGIVVTT